MPKGSIVDGAKHVKLILVAEQQEYLEQKPMQVGSEGTQGVRKKPGAL